MNRYLKNGIKILSIALFLICWQIVAKIIRNEYLFPDIFLIIKGGKEIVGSSFCFEAIFATLKKLCTTILFSTIFAILFSCIASKYRFFRVIILPYINFIKAVPTIALIIIILIWTRIEVVPVVVGIFIIFPILYDNILNSILNINRDYLRLSQVFEISKFKQIINIYIPSVYFNVEKTLPSLIGLAFKVIIAGEVIAQDDNSIGGAILLSKIYLESNKIFAWVIIVIFINYSIETLIKFGNYRVTKWKENL